MRRIVRRPLFSLLTVSLCVGGVLSSACKGEKEAGAKKDGEAAAEPKEAAAVVGATIDTAATHDFIESVDAFGVVAARAGHVASGSAPAPTRVTHVNVTVGAQVKAGDVLISFEQVAFDAALQTAEAQLATAEKSVARAQRLVDAGVSPRKDAETASAELAAAKAAVTNARRAKELTDLRAPIGGVVTRINTVMGASVDAGQSLVEVTDPSSPDVLLNVSPADAARLRTGSAVTVTANSDAGAPAIGKGRVVDIGALVDSASRTVAVRASLNNTARTVRIGETVFAHVTVAQHTKAVIIPNDALVPSGEGFRVFVVDDNGLARARSVTIGGRSDQGVWIREGLKAGERIVTHGAYGVDDSVRVVPGKAPPEKEEGKAASEKGAADKDEAGKAAPKKP